jgi:hypothetical protein
LEATTQQQVTIPSTPIHTLADEKQFYRTHYAMAKKFGLEAFFVAEFGTEEQWLNQFTKQPYDEGNK